MLNLNVKTNNELVTNLKILVERERKIGVEILEYLSEVENRKLHLKLGYSSIFEFAVRELKYSDGSAYRRIEAMRAMREIPILKEKINEGSLNVSTIADVACVLKAEVKREKSSMNNQKRTELYLSFTGKSTREVRRELAVKFPYTDSSVTRGSEFKTGLSVELESKLREFKALASHRLKIGSDTEILELMLELSLRQIKLDKQITKDKQIKNNKVITSAPEKRSVDRIGVKNQSRYIPIDLKRLVWKRAQAKCEYVNLTTKKRCESGHYLQIDHIKPFSYGGSSADAGNLQLMCGAHNRYVWSEMTNLIPKNVF